jgi:threonine dehydrogenase-like Zn-dependent dehydrogenase
VSQAVVAADFWLSIIEPGKVLDRNVGLDKVPDGYRAMSDREAIKVMVTP